MRISIFLAASLITGAATLPAAANEYLELNRARFGCGANKTTPENRISDCSVIINSKRADANERAMALVARSITRTEKGDRTGGLGDLEESIRVQPTAAAYRYRGMLLVRAKEFDRGIADFTRAIELAPEEDADYYRIRAHARWQTKDYTGAAADLTKAIEIDVAPKQDYALRGMLYEFAGEKKKAVADYELALEADPDNEQLRRSVHKLGGTIPASAALPPGDCSENVPNEKRAAACAAVIASGKLTGWTLRTAYCNRGVLLTDMGDYNTTIAESNKLLGFDPNAACGYLNRGRALYHKGDVDKAVADYNETIRLDPKFHEAFANRGTAHHSRGEYARAIADYDIAIRIEPRDPMYHSDRGNSRLLMGDATRAIPDLSRAIELEADNAKTYIRRGDAFLATREFARAEADFKRSLELSPNDAYARQGLAKAKKQQAASDPKGEVRTQTARPNETGFDRFQRVLRSE